MNMDNIVSGFFSLLEPGLVRGLLNAIGGPIRVGNGALTDVELTINPKGNSSVSSCRTHSPSKHWVKTIEANDSKEITGMDLLCRRRKVAEWVALLHLELWIDAMRVEIKEHEDLL
jgi:hypothetical protein